MLQMFGYCSNILDLDLSIFITNKVIDFHYIFVFETPLVADMGHGPYA